MKQYSFYNTDLLIAGLPVTGFADGNSIISASRSRESHNKVVGARGDVTINTIADLTGTISFSLLHTSEWNAYLRAYIMGTQTSGLSGASEGFAYIPDVMIKDKMGNDFVNGFKGWISANPTLTRGTGIAVVNWTIDVERIDFLEDNGDAGILGFLVGASAQTNA